MKQHLHPSGLRVTPNQGKRILITGASGEIGVALVEEFQKLGHQVFGTDIRPKPDQLDTEHFVQMDLQELVLKAPDERRKMMTEAFGWDDEFGLDVLINNAAIQLLGSVEVLDVDTWQATLNVNLLAPYVLVKTFLPNLEKAGGTVVNISSIHSRLTKAGFVAYATSKAALSGMTRALAVELGDRVRINAIEPASIETAMLRASFNGREKYFEGLAECHPQGRIGTPGEIAALVCTISLGDFKFLHGACIDMSGGIAARLHDVT